MPLLQTSQDVLNLSLALSALGLAFLLGWLLIYFILIVRRMVKIMNKIEATLESLNNFFTIVKEKLTHSATYLSVLASGAKELISFFTNKTKATNNQKSKRPPPIKKNVM